MKRIIEFRGKSKNGGWVYGAYHEHVTRTLCAFGDELKDGDIKHLIIQDGFSDWNMPRGIEAVEVLEDTVGQYIGVKDAHNRRIYEGDITLDEDGDIGVVLWDNSGLEYVCEFVSGAIFGVNFHFLKKLKVIGNIIDNPELLENN